MKHNPSQRTNGSLQTYLGGDNNVICDICGRKRKRSECDLAFGTGTLPVVMSCRDGCADYNHPLNYPPPVIFDGRPVMDARPEAPDKFVSSTNTIDRWGSFNIGYWGSFNGLNNSFSFNPMITWGNF